MRKKEPKAKIVPERSRLEIDGVFDIETEKWDKYRLGMFLGSGVNKSKEKVCDWNSEDEFAEFIFSLTGSIWAHNGGRYDTLWLLNHARKRGKKAEIFASSARITLVQFYNDDTGEKLAIRDSNALIPLALSDAAGLAGLRKASTGFRCTCNRACGGYCRITDRMTVRELKTLTKYLHQDCLCTLRALESLQTYADKNNLDLCGTIGASAWKTIYRTTKAENAYWKSGRDYNFARGGYFGGRTQVFKPISKSGYRYDINSAYPAALSVTQIPIGPYRFVENSTGASREYDSGRAGIYQCSITVPESMHIPPLPVRLANRIAFPVGELVGIWARPEIENAIAHGCTLNWIQRAMVWDCVGRVLKPFVDHVWNLRAEAAKVAGDKDKSPLAKWLKLYANSATGKFAQNPETEMVIMDLSRESVACHASDDCFDRLICKEVCCKHHCSRRCGRWDNLDKAGTIWTKLVWRLADCANIQFAAYLTAVTRVVLFNGLVSAGLSAVYCDTDSIFSECALPLDIGFDLGQWTLEGGYKRFHGIAPKTYRYFDTKKNKYVGKSKGIPKALDHWANLVGHNNVEINDGVFQLRTAAKKSSLFVRKEMHRAINADSSHYGDRLRNGSLTYPRKLQELIDEGL